MNATVAKLFQLASEMRSSAYVPYSKFRVGVALLCEDGTIVTGCNVENAAYPLSTCAERVAITKAVSEGRKKFRAIAVSADLDDELISPCGGCRQIMTEFGDFDVYLVHPDGSRFHKTSVKELLPASFTPDQIMNFQKAVSTSAIDNPCGSLHL